MNCNTKEEADLFFKECDKLKICLKHDYLKENYSNSWNAYFSETCYLIKGDLELKFEDRIYFYRNGCKIVECKDLIVTSDEPTMPNEIISEIHKYNCEIEVLEHLQKWIIEQNDYLKSENQKPQELIKVAIRTFDILDKNGKQN